MTGQEMADYLGVRRATVSDWETDKQTAPRHYLGLMALLAEPSDVAMEWLEGVRDELPPTVRGKPTNRPPGGTEGPEPAVRVGRAEDIFRATVELRRLEGRGFTPAEVLDLHARYLENRSEDERAMRDGGGDPRDSGPYAATQ